MRQIDEQLQRAQQEQAARQEDLQKGRVRVERPERESSNSSERQKTSA